MNFPEWFKPALIGAVVGAVAVWIVGFAGLGWVGETKAENMAELQAKREVVAALAPICVMQAKEDPQFDQTFARIMKGRSYERGNLLMKTGWATMPGSSEPDREVASACADTLQKKS